MEKLHNIELGNVSVPKGRIRVRGLDEKSISEFAEGLEQARAAVLKQNPGKKSTTGLLQPIVVRPIKGEKFELVDGERRLSAFRLLSKRNPLYGKIPCVVREMTSREAFVFQLVSNEQREDFEPAEKGYGYYQAWKSGLFESGREVARAVGVDRTTVNQYIRFFEKMPKKIVEGFRRGEISKSHIRLFFMFPDNERRLRLYEDIASEELTFEKANEEANQMDDTWLPGERELLRQKMEEDRVLQGLLSIREVRIRTLKTVSYLTYRFRSLEGLRGPHSRIQSLLESLKS